MCFEML
jgi:hypothetical protein